MGKLDDATIYLSGPLDYCSYEEGIQWRKHFIDLIHMNNLRIKCIDPTNKPMDASVNYIEKEELKSQREEWQNNGEFDKIKQCVRRFRRLDLRFVDISDILVARIMPEICQYGTANEIFLSESQHKPRLAICSGGLKKLPQWLFDVFELNDVFDSVEGVIDRLIRIDNGSYPVDDRWVLIRKHLNKL